MMLIMAVSLYTSRIILNALGIVDYGVYNVVGGMVVMFGFLNSALAQASQRYIAYGIEKDSVNMQIKTFSMLFNVHIIIAIVILALSETIGLWLFYNKLVIPEERMASAFWVMQFSIISLLVSVTQVPYNASIFAHEKMNAYAYISIVEVFLKLGVVIVIKYCFEDKLIAYGALTMGASLVIALLYRLYCVRKFSNCHYIRYWSPKLFKELFSYTSWSLIGNLAWTFNSQGMNILINMFFGPVFNAARGIAFQVNGIVMQFVNNFQMAVNPQIVKHYAAGETNQMIKLSTVNSKLAAFLLLFLLVPLFIEIDFVLHVWLGEYPAYAPIFLRIILIQSVVQTMTRPIVMMIHAVGKMKLANLTAGSALLLILPVSYVLLKLGASPVTVFMVNVVPWFLETVFDLLCLKKYIGMPPLAFYKSVYCRVFPVGALMFVLPYTTYYMMSDGWLRFISVGIVSVLSSSLLIYFLGLDKNMRVFVIRSILKR